MSLYRVLGRRCIGDFSIPWSKGIRGLRGYSRGLWNASNEPAGSTTMLDVCRLPVMTSSWKAVKSLDKACTEDRAARLPGEFGTRIGVFCPTLLKYANLNGDPQKHIEQALAEDPCCVMAHCLKGLLTALEHSNPSAVVASLERAEKELAAGSTGSFARDGDAWKREETFVATLGSWSAGRWRQGALKLEKWLMTAPIDLLALKLAQDAHLLLGDAANVRDCVARVLPCWNEGVFGYANVLGMYAFGLAENGAYSAAEEHADLAMARRQEDMWAVHAMSQVYEMEARASEGCSFLTEAREDWEDRSGPLTAHLAWHLGMFSLERGLGARTLRVFDSLLMPREEGGKGTGSPRAAPPSPFALADACSLLWRMDIYGVETGPHRWRSVAEAWSKQAHTRHLSTFLDLHALMAFSAMMEFSEGGADDDVERDTWVERAEGIVSSMRDYVGSQASWSGSSDAGWGEKEPHPRERTPPGVVELHSFSPGRRPGSRGAKDLRSSDLLQGGPPDNLWVAENLGLPLCEAMLAYKKGDFERTVSLLLPLRYHLDAIGGSHDQQDVVNLTLIDAALRLQDPAIARALVCERRIRRPGSGRAWEAYAVLMERAGNERAEFEARKMAYELGIGQGGFGAN